MSFLVLTLMTMASDWLTVFLLLYLLIRRSSSDITSQKVDKGTSSPSNPKPDILQKVEGKVQVNSETSDDWMLVTQVCLDGGEYCGFLKSSGDFVIHNVPPGSYLVQVFSPNYVFDPVRVDISSKNGKIRARRVNLLKSSAVSQLSYPLRFQAEEQAKFFEKRESWSLLSTLKNPMVVHIAWLAPVYNQLVLKNYAIGATLGCSFVVNDGSSTTYEKHGS